jgi:adenosine deaminase
LKLRCDRYQSIGACAHGSQRKRETLEREEVMLSGEMKEFIQRIPKAELHCHLEGSIQPRTLIELGSRHGVDLPFEDEAGAREFYRFTSLNQFLEIFALACGTLRTAADFETITVDLGEDAARQNIPYREVFFTQAYHDRRGVPWEEVIAGLASGREINRQQHGVEMWFIADIDRTIEPEDAVRLVEKAHEARQEAGIIGIGLDSQEIGYPAARQKPAYDRAAELGFRRVAHAGEDVGPESVWDAIKSLHVDRVDHGVRSVEDDELIHYLVASQLPLTVCPVSNVALKVYPEMSAHPVKELLDAGVKVTINSDDPPMFHTDVLNDYTQVVDTFGLSVDEVVQLARNSFEASFMEAGRKAAYLERFDREAADLRSRLFG